MIYNSFDFLIIFPLFFLLYYVIPAKAKNVRNGYLLVVSYMLYMKWNAAYALILLGVTAVTYSFTLKVVGNQSDSRRKRTLIICGIILSVIPMLVFKYTNFICDTINSGMEWAGLGLPLGGLNWVIPIGISFFTFQAVGYMLDVYYGKIEAEKNFLDYALFISFFPSIMSGPINKASLVLPQLKADRPDGRKPLQ